MTDVIVTNDDITIEVPAEKILEVCTALRSELLFQFDMLIDVCGVDYLEYGLVEWATDTTTATGFSRAVEKSSDKERITDWKKPRFAVVYHLLSLPLNQRLRVRTFPAGEPPQVDSVESVWASANWFEREAFDLYGILFNGHSDLRRILTDYGFVGHPFRKDFPISGYIEVRYDASQGRVIYEPVNIEPRILVPKVGRHDNRYLGEHPES
ncbi:MAG: NADH-quinone oxidoreductase subunit C [Proteobacteria bacterium]|nr:NADH-quinone oxidoreductase subunit C [Pseudomonadota bacterium]